LRSRSSLGGGLALFLVLPGLFAQPAAPTSAGDEFFETEVRPLLVEKCAKCHGDVKPRGGLKLTSRAEILKGGDGGPAVVPGKADESLLLKAVRYQGEPRMPPQGKLTARQIEVLDRWVRQGAPWPGAKDAPAAKDGRLTITDDHRRFWAFQPFKAGPLPAVRNAAWPRSAPDHFILAKLEAGGLAPAAPADRRTLLRRATFDLIGLPPTPAETEAFLADDSPRAFARIVDRLLASPLYGERWGRHWLDVVRYADARDLIQLPPESDFREAWRYRDWVVESFNRDLPYAEFIRHQVAGDLLPPVRPGGINRDGLTATGLLAIADFVPGDVDKEQMIADYVNDQIDVVSRSFLGLSVACARCHDHKFDPVTTEDYYALAGIFFSTRIIPGPVPGNTPLVRVPLLAPAEIAELEKQAAADARRRAELEPTVPHAADREYRAHLTAVLAGQSARYLAAAHECRTSSPAAVAKRHELHEGLLAEWVAFLDRTGKQPPPDCPRPLRDIATGELSGRELRQAADALQEAFAARAKLPEKPAALHHFRADDPRLVTDAAGKVTLWPNRGDLSGDAVPPAPKDGPVKAAVTINGRTKTVLRFDGQSLLAVAGPVPPVGSLVIVFQTAPEVAAGARVVGWEDADTGRHGLGLMPSRTGRLHAILRQNGKSGDVLDGSNPAGFETVGISWGPGGTALRRNGVETAGPKGVDGLSSDPWITALRIGGPGAGASPRFTGDVAELRVYNRTLDAAERDAVEAELRETWFRPDDPKKPPRDPLADLFDELRSGRGPFWATPDERAKRLAPEVRTRLAGLDAELKVLRSKPAATDQIPRAVAAQDGGPKGTRHEGFKDSTVFIRGDHKRPGKTVPRGFPKVLPGGDVRIAEGSGRLPLADWLTRPENPLPARVMVNRIWQHHFGEGLVRTPNDFGERGERPTHPDLLDYLAATFVESGWSVKAMHRLIMNSAAYQQGSRGSPAALAGDPDNRLLGHMTRRRLDAEAIRDSLLSVSGRLDAARGGPPFTDLAVPRRTLYLMSARTGANTSDFGRLFNRADPSMIVARRDQSVVAPQALFFLNDPFVTNAAKALAARVGREAPGTPDARIHHLYALTLGRPPTTAELELGKTLLTPAAGLDPWERYCLLILCTNEFLYVD
jgi:cytochrome c553